MSTTAPRSSVCIVRLQRQAAGWLIAVTAIPELGHDSYLASAGRPAYVSEPETAIQMVADFIRGLDFPRKEVLPAPDASSSSS
jgi:hypothetical protein